MKKSLFLVAALLAACVCPLKSQTTDFTPAPYDLIEDQLNGAFNAVLPWWVHIDPNADMIRYTDGSNGGAPTVAYLGTGLSINHTTHTLEVSVSAPARSFNHSPSAKTIQTVAASANGFQVSSTRDSSVNYSVTIQTTVSLSGNATGYVVLEVCSTNSATAGNWLEIGRSASGQSGTLVVGLTLTQTGGGQLGGIVPAGYYTRLRSVNTAGTPTYSYTSGQEVLL